MVLNHEVARIVLVEQIYRQGYPYVLRIFSSSALTVVGLLRVSIYRMHVLVAEAHCLFAERGQFCEEKSTTIEAGRKSRLQGFKGEMNKSDVVMEE